MKLKVKYLHNDQENEISIPNCFSTDIDYKNVLHINYLGNYDNEITYSIEIPIYKILSLTYLYDDNFYNITFKKGYEEQ